MRIAGRGLVDHGRSLEFSFDGRDYVGVAGDTLASALLANGVRLFGRSFKYHRPRGVVTAGPEEPNALVTVGSGHLRVPNVRATVQEIFAGLEARSQNRWPSLSRDVMAVNDVLAPWLAAGFYYKTFMWPPGFWTRMWEPLIRRAAGLGALQGEPDGLPREKAYAFCDVLVIGGGPAGLVAAQAAARAGADVVLADEGDRPGGRLLSEIEEVGGRPGWLWAAEAAAELETMPNVRLMRRTTVTGAYDQGTYGALERAGPEEDSSAGAPVETFWRIVARRAILAAGAIERPIAFPDNDRPGVMLAGAVRSYLNRYGVTSGRRVAVFGNNDDAHRTARDLSAAGVEVAALIDSRPGTEARGDFPIFAGAVVTGTRGRLGLREIKVLHGSGTETVPTDCLAVSGGWNPTVHISSHMGRRPVWSEATSAFVPANGAVPGLEAAGAANGVLSTAGCIAEGARAACEALVSLGLPVPHLDLPDAEDGATSPAPLWWVPGRGRAWLDFQNDVTVKDVALAAQENFRSVEHMKRYTTQGMATDQGKLSNLGALAVLADATGRGIAETGTTTFRPPYTPVTIAAMGAGGEGRTFAPDRHTTTHATAKSLGAPMVEAGLWHRAAYFPRAGETDWRESCDREVTMVRAAVGVADVSTLGKIDVQGADAAAFLDFVYANWISTMRPGRVRYGLMLREDGHVMDDGTVARLDEGHFLVTTTTAAAEQVIAHLEFVRQGLRPELDVQLAPVTEQWAQFAVAGPRSRELLATVLDDGSPDVGFMGCSQVGVSGAAGRLFRISFSGELGFEVAVPANFGDALFRLLHRLAVDLGGGAYGTEALNVLRIEKGFPTHAEMDGRTTAFDLGLARMVAADKDCIGRTMAARGGLMDPARPQLVGLRAQGASVTAGAHLFRREAAHVRENSEGHVSSACHSPTLGSDIALAFLRHGRTRHGERIVAVDHMRKIESTCEVGPPVFVDPNGGRARA